MKRNAHNGLSQGLVALFLACVVAPNGFAQQNRTVSREAQVLGPARAALVPYRKGTKWGFSTLDKKVVIPLQFDTAAPFHEGLAAVRVGHKRGYIDPSGKIVIPLVFDRVWGFSNGRARVSVNGKYGLVDRTGAFVAAAKYDFINPMSDGMLVVASNMKFTAIDLTGREISAFPSRRSGSRMLVAIDPSPLSSPGKRPIPASFSGA